MSECNPKSNCATMAIIELIAKKWTLIIIKTVSEWAGSYSTIEKQIPEINPSVLSSRLKELQSIGFINKKIVSSSPVKIEYSLSKKWESFSKQVENIVSWAQEWM